MKKKCIEFSICLLLISSTTALALTTSDRYIQQEYKQYCDTTTPLPISRRWMKTFGGIDDDIGYCVQQTRDGGYIITGSTRSFAVGMDDLWLIKTNRNGEIMWEKTFGGKNTDHGISVQQTSDDGYIITGLTQSFSIGLGSVWLIKVDGSGEKIWEQIFGGTKYDGGNSVQQTSDGGYIITGFTTSFGDGDADVWLIKTDSEGDRIWDTTFGGADIDYAECVQQTSDGGYIITGLTQSYGVGSEDVWLIKTDMNGVKMWDVTFGGIDIDNGKSVLQTTDGGFIITGLTQSFGAGLCDLWLIKTDDDGNKIWDKTFGGTKADCGYAVCQISDNGYIIIGSTQSFGTDLSDFWLIKTDSNGDVIWQKTFGGTRNDEGYSIQQTSDGGYIITGFTQLSNTDVNYDVWLIKTDSQGKTKIILLGNFWFERLFQHFPNMFSPLRYLMTY